MVKTAYGWYQLGLLYLPIFAILNLTLPWYMKAAICGGWAGLTMILMDIRGLLLHPKEARMELDPAYKAKVESGAEDWPT